MFDVRNHKNPKPSIYMLDNLAKHLRKLETPCLFDIWGLRVNFWSKNGHKQANFWLDNEYSAIFYAIYHKSLNRKPKCQIFGKQFQRTPSTLAYLMSGCLRSVFGSKNGQNRQKT